MGFSDKDKRKAEYPPSNVSAEYYNDPVYSTDAFFGFRKENRDAAHEDIQESVDAEHEDASDEPVESWGWINNVDNEFERKS